MDQLAYHHRNLLSSWQSTLGWRTFRMFAMAVSAGEPPIAICRYSFRPLRADAFRLLTESTQGDDFRVGEVRFFKGSEELPRDKSWRLTASDNPWEVQLAFDNNPISYWTSGTAAKPGMGIQVNFAQSQEITGVAVEQTSGQKDWPLSLWFESRGRWQRIPIQEQRVDLTAPDNIRRTAAAAMKASGVEWILIHDGDLGADDLGQKAAYWGAVPVGREGDFRLWKLE